MLLHFQAQISTNNGKERELVELDLGQARLRYRDVTRFKDCNS